MKKDYSVVYLLIDESGSMYPYVSDTLGSVKNFITEFSDKNVDVCIDTFSSYINEVCFMKHIKDFKITDFEYKPSGGTAIYDAFGIAINKLGLKLAKYPEEERPEKVMIALITDGEENSSREFTSSQIKEMIQHQTEKYNWDFIYLSANADAVFSSASLGIQTSIDYNVCNTRSAYQTLNNVVSKGLSGEDIKGMHLNA